MNNNNYRYYIDLIFVLTKKEIKVRYKNSVLGYVWSIANPLLYSIIFYFVFKIVMKFQIKQYSLFLISGLFPWQWISNSITMSASVFINNASLVKKVAFPRYFLLLAQILNDGFHFLISIPVIVIFCLFYKHIPDIEWFIYILLLLLPTFLCILGISFIVSSINVIFRDIQHIINLIMTLLFYLTPVFYDIDFVPKKYILFINFNPFASIIINWRLLFMHNYIDFSKFLLSLVWGIFLVFIGYFIYFKLNCRFAELL